MLGWLLLLAVAAFLILGLLGLVFGGEDPYERELWEMDRHEELVDAMRYNKSRTKIDARSVHLHNHQHK